MRWMLAIFAVAAVIAFLAWKLCIPAQRPTTPPALLAQWEDNLYSLDPDEDVRFIPPPFSPQRPARYSLPPSLKRGISWQQLMVRVTGNRIFFSGASSGKGTVLSAFSWVTYLTKLPDLELPQELAKLPADGDWIVREEAPLERRMKALESILSGITGRKLSIERPLVERDVVIARGKWDFHPSNDPNTAQFYIPVRDMQRGGMGTLADSFKSLGELLRRKVLDETDEPRPREVFWTGTSNIIYSRKDGEDGWRAAILAMLEKQTSLKFVQTKRAIPVWIVSDRSAATQPVHQ